MTRVLSFVDELKRHRRRIEFEANRLLQEFRPNGQPITEPPVPIDEIVEQHLDLGLAFADLEHWAGKSKALGALILSTEEILVDRSLDPEEHPELEGRYRFTLAHEVGHWRLHADAWRKAEEEDAPLDRDETHRYEREADAFAACLLMPRRFVFAKWRQRFGGQRLSVAELSKNREDILFDEMIRRGFAPQSKQDERNMMLEWAVRPLAQAFQVSPPAMRIRMEELRLVAG